MLDAFFDMLLSLVCAAGVLVGVVYLFYFFGSHEAEGALDSGVQ